ncbi:aldehyde dehydrogenase family protein [Halomonas sp. THAF12]|uniref:aldehyde dehydrogenase family protein n=1 Tax=Halomonas sp. B23F22_10 TaxID=3459515 RepID=UPI00373EE818
MNNPFRSIFDRQKEAFLTDRSKSREWRLDQLARMERMLLDHQDRWCESLYEDFRKPAFEQRFEITVPMGNIAYYRDNLDRLMAPEEVEIPEGLAKLGQRGVIRREPYGVTLVIGPFNAPILLLLDPAIAALAAGNPVILKPANTTPATAALFAELIPQYFASEDVSVVTGGREQISALLELPFDFIFFTGSATVGKIVMRAAAEHLTPVLLELGGQNPTIVDSTADLDRAADAIAWGHNAISGQWCIAPGFVCVHDSVAEAFVEKLKASVTRMYGEDPVKSPDFARMISEKDAARVQSYILPEKTVLGGRSNQAERYVEPTLLYPSDWSDPAMQQEIFGPVLPILRFDDLEALIARLKTRDKPLAAYIFSQDEATIERFLHAFSFGGGCVNLTNLHCWVGSLPFGGVGMSGMGKYYGKAGYEALSNAKSLLISPADKTLDVYPPYADKDIDAMLAPFS